MSVLYAPSMAWTALLVGLTISCFIFFEVCCSITGAGNYPKSFWEMFSASFFWGFDGVVGYGLDYGFSHIEMDLKNRN